MIVTTHGLVRLGRRTGSRRPYAEALAGFKGFSTDSRFPTYSYGVGVGIQFPLARRTREGEHQLVEIGVRYPRGGGAHLTEHRSTSRSNSVMLHVGMVFHD
jgi:hypothetical protein